MDGLNNSAGGSTRRLLEGERVEVLQKERGLRGAWYPGIVVKVKHGRRVVEYDELFTLDGSRKLRESIPLVSGETKLRSFTRRETILEDSKASSLTEWRKNGSIDGNRRGFIRPIPPSCAIPSKMNWKMGLLVDAIYNDAWWEGILLNDVVSDCEEFRAKVFFPEEGDELEVSLKHLRVSQEWDEASGLWAVRGYWLFDGGIDLSPMKEICLKTKCPLKDLWRQKRFFSLEDVLMQEQKARSQHAAEFTHIMKPPGIQPALKVLKSSESSTHDNLLTLESNRDYCHLSVFKGDGKCPTTDVKSCQSVECGESSLLGSGHDFNDSKREIIEERSNSASLVHHDFLSSGNTCRKFEIGSSKHQSVEIAKENSPSTSMLSGKGKYKPIVAKINLRKRVNGHDSCLDRKQADIKSLSFSLDSSANVDVLSLDENGLRNNVSVTSESQLPSMKPAHHVGLSVEKELVSAGWKIESRSNSGSAMKCKTQYISPDGSKFLSLRSACRRLRASKESCSSLVEETNRVLSVNNLSKGIKFIQTTTGKIILKDEPLKDKHDSDFQDMPEIMDFKYGARGNITQCSERTTRSSEKSKKRSIEGCMELLSVEPKRKRGRPSHKASQHFPGNNVSGVKGSCRMQVLLSFPEKGQNAVQDIGMPPQFKRSTVFSWLLDKGILRENESVCYVNKKDGRVMKQGKVTREGVMCDCCNDIFTLSSFELHAGSKLHRPSANTFLDDGRSISDCQLEALALQDTKVKEGIMDVSDDVCSVCGDGGDLVLCDHCPSAFHVDCIGLLVIPEGDWYCPRCSCCSCGLNQHIGELDSQMHRCVQCELKYHVSCAPGCSLLSSNQADQKSWFCDEKCRKIFLYLRRLVGVMHSLENGFSWTLLRSMKRGHALSRSSLEVMADHHSKIAVAHGVMQECFAPMIDPRTKINLISQALYNRRSKVARLNYCGFYTIILERGDEIITVATIRVHGPKLAEVPLIGTRYQYRRQGMCRRLMHAVEEMLKNVGVEKLILPAVPELLETWIGAFGFQKMSLAEIQESSGSNLMTFPGTTLLQKHLLDVTHLSGKFHDANEDGTSKNPCGSIEEFFNMAGTSLDGLADGSLNKDISLQDIMMFNYMQDVLSDDQDIREAYLTPEFVKPKNRIRLKVDAVTESPSTTDGKLQEDDTKVVIGTTRSKRLIKSRRWVADGLRELKDSRQPRWNSLTEEISINTPAHEIWQAQKPKLGNTDIQVLEHDIIFENTNMQDMGQITNNVYLRTRRKPLFVSQDSMNVSALKLHHSESWESSISSSEDDLRLLTADFAYTQFHRHKLMDGLKVCPKFYIRRKKRSNALENSKVNDGSGYMPLRTLIDYASQDILPDSIRSSESTWNDGGRMQISTNDCNFNNDIQILVSNCNAIAGKEDTSNCVSDVAPSSSDMLTDKLDVISMNEDARGVDPGFLASSFSHDYDVIDGTSAMLVDHSADSNVERLACTAVCSPQREAPIDNSTVAIGKVVVSINDPCGNSGLVIDDFGFRENQVELHKTSSVVSSFKEELVSCAACSPHREAQNNNLSVLSCKAVSSMADPNSGLITDDGGVGGDQVKRHKTSSVIDSFKEELVSSLRIEVPIATGKAVVSINDFSGNSGSVTDDCCVGDDRCVEDDRIKHHEKSSVVSSFKRELVHDIPEYDVISGNTNSLTDGCTSMAGDAGRVAENFNVLSNAGRNIQRLGSSNLKKLAV